MASLNISSGFSESALAGRLNRLVDFAPVLIALLLALVVSSVLLIALNANPFEAFDFMLKGAVGSENATAETLVKATPILFVGIGITIAFRGGMINIGGEGQMIAGALAGVTVALVLGEARVPAEMAKTPGAFDLIIVTCSLLGGFLMGALYGGLAGFLKAYFDVNEILSTIMLNQIAVQMMNFLLNGILLDPAEAGFNNIPKTARLVTAAQLPRLSLPIGDPWLFARTRLHWGLIIAMVLAVIIYIFLWRTSWGYRIRAVGENQRASSYAGINVKRQMMFSMFLAGGFAGLAGVVQVLGLQYRLQTDGSPAGFTGAAGFNGIVAALFGGLNPIGAIPAAAFFGGLLVGAQKMQRELGVPASLITAVNGLIVVFVVSSEIFILQRSKRRVSEGEDETPSPNPSPKMRQGLSPAEGENSGEEAG
ncbi:MAG: ABC transporter permease [Chloroflexota bacterium]|nr:ABC transporter permease [Chloroflexota bacterium]